MKEKRLIDKGVQILKLDGPRGHVDLLKLMDELYKLEIDSLLLEGGEGLMQLHLIWELLIRL